MPDVICGCGESEKIVGIIIPTNNSESFLKINPHVSLNQFVGIISREIRLL